MAATRKQVPMSKSICTSMTARKWSWPKMAKMMAMNAG